MDSPTSVPLTERVADSIKQLTTAAEDLNAASGEMGQAVAAIDVVLQNLNIGVPTWTRITGGSDQPNGEDFFYRDLGYAKVNNKWGIALRDVSGNYNFPDDEDYHAWLFNDAPRWLRIEGVEKIPNLLDELIKNAKETTAKIKAKTTETNQLATAIATAAEQAKGTNTAANSGLQAVLVRPAAAVVADAPKPLGLGSVVGVSVQVSPPVGAKKPKGRR